jgi:transcriptional regulator with GAF, ATPase, and Fis domain
MMLNDLLAEMALELQATDSPAETVETISQYASAAVAADGAGLMVVHAGGKIETVADTSGDIEKAHQLQAEYGEGPCLEALKGGDDTYLVTDTANDSRWARWGKGAASMGFRSVISSTLETSTRRIGSLNVYATRADAFDKSDAEAISWLATHASVAIAAVDEREGIRFALLNRTVIGQAEGILMQTFDIDADKAFAYMKRLSQDTNTKLYKIAEEIVESRAIIGQRQTV